MEKIIRISPRRSGKSTLAHYEFMKAPEKTCFIFPNSAFKEDMIARFPGLKAHSNNLLTQKSSLRGRKYSRCVIDEMLLFDEDNFRSLFIDFPFVGIQEFLAFCTDDKDSNMSLSRFIKEVKDARLIFDEARYTTSENKIVTL